MAVIGAGPGGIAAGMALHQAGLLEMVFERHPESRPLGGAIILNAKWHRHTARLGGIGG